MDVGSFYENLQPGTVLSGLVMGYIVLRDELDINRAVHRLIDIDYVCVKRRPRNLSVLTRIRRSIETNKYYYNLNIDSTGVYTILQEENYSPSLTMRQCSRAKC